MYRDDFVCDLKKPFIPMGYLIICVCLASLPADGTIRGQCKPFELNMDEFHKRIRRFRELDVFDNWRLVRMQAERCTDHDPIYLELIFEPPSFWSSLRAPYRFSLGLMLDQPESKPKNLSKKHFQTVAKNVHRMILRIEADIDVQRFLERFSMHHIEIRSHGELPELRATFQAQPIAGSSTDKRPSLVYSDKSDDGGVVGYELPRMDSLPVRRELLRCMESVSLLYPNCKPTWIKAALKETQENPKDGVHPTATGSNHWSFEIDLYGKQCPEQYHGVVFQNEQGVYNQILKTQSYGSP